MNVLARGITSLARACIGNSFQAPVRSLMSLTTSTAVPGSQLLKTATKLCMGNIMQGFEQTRTKITLLQLHKKKGKIKSKQKRSPLEGKPFAKATVIRPIIKKPKKPNSANRKCVLVRLSTGRETTAYVPGIGHNLQEHNIVLCRVGRLRDVPGVKIKCVRGKYDLPHVVKRER